MWKRLQYVKAVTNVKNISAESKKKLRQMWKGVTNMKNYTVENEKLLALHM